MSIENKKEEDVTGSSSERKDDERTCLLVIQVSKKGSFIFKDNFLS